MLKIGNYNTLPVVKIVDFGVYLDGGEGREILLPRRYVGRLPEVGDKLDVFVYTDSEDRLIATTEHPVATVGEFAYMQVTQVNRVGAFLDWGLSGKNLLVPFREQRSAMRDGGIYLVYVYLDDVTGRVAASAKVDKFLGNVIADYKRGDKVDALIIEHNESGYKAIVDNLHNGLFYNSDIYSPLVLEQHIEASVKNVRPDGKIDLVPVRNMLERTDEIARLIMKKIEADGVLRVTDKSSPEEIRERFGCSKKDYKKAIGSLYRKRLILLEEDRKSVV